MSLLALLAPRRCVSCSAPGTLLCAACRRETVPVRAPVCERCGEPVALRMPSCRACRGTRGGLDRARSALELSGVTADLVHAWKRRSAALGPIAVELVVELVEPPAGDVLCAVPADPERRLARGCDPPAELARGLAEAWRLTLDLDLLVRRRGTRPQRGLAAAERRRNLRDAFAAQAPPRVVVLVDDVYTTGETAHACARALKRAGAGEVHVVTFARTPRDRGRPPRGGILR